MYILIIILLIIVLIIIWSVFMPFYREKTIPLIPDESKCFSERCHSIIYKEGNKKAVLFIHGFPTTPYMYKWATEYMRVRSYDVFAPLIPTFGADIKEFEKSNFSSWFSYIDNYYMKLRKEYGTLNVIGVSMGGAMTLKLTEIHSDDGMAPDAIAVISAPVVYNSLFRDHIVTKPAGYFIRLIKLFIPSINAEKSTGIAGHNDGDENWTGYRGLYSTPGCSLIWNLKRIRKDLCRIHVPMISIHDEGDKTVPYGNQGIIKRETDTDSVFISQKMGDEYIHTHHALLSYNSCQKELMDIIYAFLEEKNEQKRRPHILG